jgi:hypothetical protein
MRVSMIVFILLGLLLSGCGLESTVPSEQSSSPSRERAVFISSIEETPSGSVVTCALNEVLVSDNMEVPLFLEFEGVMVERVILSNQGLFSFHAYDPPSDGRIVCVVELADAEFESEEAWLEH